MLRFEKSYLAIPILLLAILAMIILPLPAQILDILFTFNIVLAVVVLLVVVTNNKPLDFSAFPTVLLIATLMRLTLNVASTRVVLLHGHEGTDSAGQVIQAFGEVVIGGNYVVGIVIFIILMVINFVVITKGGERISEVAARFTLDAMPGKQMAIDADLNAGLIDSTQAQERRQGIAQEADFYGSMDGASKFVRGDAIAGLIILFINLLGGLAIGVFMHQLSATESFQKYALLTIGDGLVAQIPSLLLSISAAIVVTRVNTDAQMPTMIGQQLLASPKVIMTVAAIMAILGLIPGMPTLAFFIFALPLFFTAWKLNEIAIKAANEQPTETIVTDTQEHQKLAWEDLPYPDLISIELGFSLVPFVEKKRGSPLTKSLFGTRRLLSEESGCLVPEFKIKDNLQVHRNEYRIKMHDQVVGQGRLQPDQLLALNTGEVFREMDGERINDPAYGLEGVWIDPSQKSQALNNGYSVVDIPTIIATHVGKVVNQKLYELIGLDDVKAIATRLKYMSPSLAEHLEQAVPSTLQMQVYRLLLAESVSIKDMRRIADALIEASAQTKDPLLLAAEVRVALKDHITQSLQGASPDLSVFEVSAVMQQQLLEAFEQGVSSGKPIDGFPIDPAHLSQIQRDILSLAQTMKSLGKPPILLTPPQLRPMFSKYASAFTSSEVSVLSYNEISSSTPLNIVGHICS